MAGTRVLDCDYQALIETADKLRLYVTSEDAAGAAVMPVQKKLLEQAKALRENGTLGEIPLNKTFPEELEDYVEELVQACNEVASLADTLREVAERGIELENGLRSSAERAAAERGLSV